MLGANAPIPEAVSGCGRINGLGGGSTGPNTGGGTPGGVGAG
jgi:hypothetical protein